MLQTSQALLAGLLILVLCAGSLIPSPAVQRLAMFAVPIMMLVYAIVTFRLLGRRRRKRFDVTQRFWQVGMLCLVLSAAAHLYSYLAATPGASNMAVLSGLLLLAGFAVSVINGMLYKIVPFLVWLNLRMPAVMGKLKPGSRYYTPNIHEVINVKPMQVQFLVHLAGLILLLAGVLAPGVPVYAAAPLMLVSNLLLLVNLAHAARLYRKYSSQVPGTK